jgi:hypothetical protein
MGVGEELRPNSIREIVAQETGQSIVPGNPGNASVGRGELLVDVETD